MTFRVFPISSKPRLLDEAHFIEALHHTRPHPCSAAKGESGYLENVIYQTLEAETIKNSLVNTCVPEKKCKGCWDAGVWLCLSLWFSELMHQVVQVFSTHWSGQVRGTVRSTL